jgi:hypothetical protein
MRREEALANKPTAGGPYTEEKKEDTSEIDRYRRQTDCRQTDKQPAHDR